MTNVTALLTQLVAFDTTSSESNLALIEFVERYLADYGVTAECDEPLRYQSQPDCAHRP